MKVLDLFSGIGGFSLGLQRAGHETVAFCEIESFPQKVLNKWWPSIPVWKDIRTLNFFLKKVLKSSQADFHAKIYQQPAGVRELPESVVDSGGRCYEPFAWYDRATRSWRTWQCCFIEGWELYSEGWPKAGMTQNGIAYRLLTSVPSIAESESGLLLPTPVASQGGYNKSDSRNAKIRPSLSTMARKNEWPTPTKHGNHNRKGASETSGDGLATAVKKKLWLTPRASDTGKGESNATFIARMGDRSESCAQSLSAQVRNPKTWPTPTVNDSKNSTLPPSQGGKDSIPGELIRDGISGELNPSWVEWLMGFPCAWTDLAASATPSCLKSSKSSAGK